MIAGEGSHAEAAAPESQAAKAGHYARRWSATAAFARLAMKAVSPCSATADSAALYAPSNTILARSACSSCSSRITL